MPIRRKVSPVIQEQVRQRAHDLCEYCHTAEKWPYMRFTIDHIIPLAAGGANTLDNLELACFHCNRRKTNKMVGLDPVTSQATPLFNPRQQAWREHFIWSNNGTQLIARTSIGRTTIETLALNRERMIRIRTADVVGGRHPPAEGPISQV